jgi:CRP/FNR family transcriptional regulator, cyclic AMP receptor protein
MNSTAMNLKLADQERDSNFLNLLSLPHVERTFWRGMAVYTLDDPAADVYVVLKGRVKIIRSSPEGARKIISICYGGEIFGEMALAGDDVEARRSDEVVALDTTRVAVIRVADFWGATRRDPSLVSDAMRHLTRRLAEAHSQIESLVFDNNHHRLARSLLRLSNEAARAGESSVRLTHEELAELIGSTREVVTGMMIEFRQRGLIDYKRGDIQPNLPGLIHFVTHST